MYKTNLDKIYLAIPRPVFYAGDMAKAPVTEKSKLLNHAAIRAAREKLGLTQKEAALAAKWENPQAWQNIEAGNQPNLNLLALERMAAVLRKKPSDLLHDKIPDPLK